MDNVFQVHERTEEMDFLLLVIRKLLRTNSQSVKVGSKYILLLFLGRINFYVFDLQRACSKELTLKCVIIFY